VSWLRLSSLQFSGTFMALNTLVNQAQAAIHIEAIPTGGPMSVARLAALAACATGALLATATQAQQVHRIVGP
jgi:hypothetical protein